MRHNKLFVAFVVAELFASLSSGMDIAIYNFWIFSITHSVLIVSLAASVGLSGPFVWGWLVGKFVDKYNPFMQFFVVYLILSISSFVPIFISSPRQLPFAFLALLFMGFASTTAGAVWPVLSTQILNPKDFGKAEGVMGILDNVRLLVGTAAGGTLYSLIGAHYSFAIEGCLLLLSSITLMITLFFNRHLMTTSITQETGQATVEANKSIVTSVKRQITLWSHPVLRRALLIGIVAQAGFAAMNSLWVPFIIVIYRGNDFIVGLTFLMQGIGGIVGGICAVRWFSKSPQLSRVRWMYLVFTIDVILYTTFPFFALLVSLILVEGILMEWGRMPLQLVWLNIPPAEIRGLTTAKKQSIISMTAVVSSIVLGTLAQFIGLRTIFYMIAVLLLVTTILSWTFRGNPMEELSEGTSLVELDL